MLVLLPLFMIEDGGYRFIYFFVEKLKHLGKTQIRKGDNEMYGTSNQTIQMPSRIEWVDVAKGLGIFLVVLGHMPMIPEMIRLWIFSFHMPLFYFISGYLFKDKSVKLPFWVIVKKKAKGLLIPYCLYSAVFILTDFLLLAGGLPHMLYSFERFLSGQGGYDILWFLFSLFVVEALFSFIYKYSGKYWKIIVLLLVMCGFSFAYLGLLDIFKISTSLVALGFYSFGVISRGKINKDYFDTHIWLAPVALISNIIISLVCIKLNGYVLDMNTAKYGNFILPYLAAMGGIYFLLFLSSLTSKYKIMIPVKYIGKNSLYFYPLTAYVPNTIVSVLELTGMDAGKLIKIISKVLGFVGTWLYIEGKNRILSKEKMLSR